MKRNPSIAPTIVAFGLLLAASSAARATSEVTQVLQLQPGWNAIFLEVQPEPADVDSVFGGLPVASVWTWNPNFGAVDFIQNPDDGLSTEEGWLAWFPPNRPSHFLTNLFAVRANRAYLVKLLGDQPVTLTVSGLPVVRSFTWVPDSFNFVGFHVDPQNPPTFTDFLAPAPELAGQPIFRLEASGVWEPVQNPLSTPIRSGEAYWIFAEGPSTYTGPLVVDLEIGDTIEYARTLSQHVVEVTNLRSVNSLVRIEKAGSGGGLPMAVRILDETTSEISWPELPDTFDLTVPAEESLGIRLAPDRDRFSFDRHETVLEISDGLGFRRFVAVGASATQAGVLPASSTSSTLMASRSGMQRLVSGATASHPFAGLWVGVVTVNAVSESQTGDFEPTPTGRNFRFRILIHVDSLGRARLLKEVIQLFEEGTKVPDPDDPDRLTTDEPGRFVLLTDEDLIPDFQGAALRDGVPVGSRLSTAAYDFEGDLVDLQGGFGPGNVLSTTLVLEPELPTNPFRHQFHPDHDNLDAQFLNFREEAYTVTRDLELEFVEEIESLALISRGQLSLEPPDWNESAVGGIYREVLSGLHRNDIFVQGYFRLQRTVATPVLNQ